MNFYTLARNLSFLSKIAMTQVQLGEREVRINKIQKLLSMGIHPYAQSFKKENYIADIIKEYENKELREIETIIECPNIQVTTA